jgi:hypothetical protein
MADAATELPVTTEKNTALSTPKHGTIAARLPMFIDLFSNPTLNVDK